MTAKGKFLAILAQMSPLCILAQGAPAEAQRLMALDEYEGHAVFEVLLPQAEDPVTYNIDLQSAYPTDTLAPCRYVIRWSTETPNGEMHGFSAYFDGNHYRFRGNRLQEYHIGANDATFRPLGPGSEHKGVQCTAQFADLLPQFLGEKIMEMESDPSYVFRFTADTLVNRCPAMVLEGVKRNSGYDVMEYCHVFDKKTGMPVKSEIINSPGSISEQIVTVTYSDARAAAVGYSEESLAEVFPEVFERYRESTFRAENLAGSKMPSFSARCIGGTERYAHHGDEHFPAPTIIVALDPEVATTAETVQAVREAVDMLPMHTDVLWAFNTNLEDEALKAIGTLRSGETALLSAGSLFRQCGITLYPTTIIADRDGTVKYVVPGFNKDFGEIVIQKCML